MRISLITLALLTLLSTPILARENSDSLHLSVQDQLQRARVLSTRDGQALSDELYRRELFGQLKSNSMDLIDDRFRLEASKDDMFTQGQLQYRNGQTEVKVFRQESTQRQLDLIGRSQDLQSQTRLNLRTDLGPRAWIEVEGSEVNVGRDDFIDFTEQRGTGRLVVEILPRFTGSASLGFLDQKGRTANFQMNTLEGGLTYHGDPIYLIVYHGRESLFDGLRSNNDSRKSYTIYGIGSAKFIDLGKAKLKPSVKFIQSRWIGVRSENREERLLVGVESLIGSKTHLVIDYGLNHVQFSEGDKRLNEVLVMTLNHSFSQDTKLGFMASWERDRTAQNQARVSTGLHLTHRF